MNIDLKKIVLIGPVYPYKGGISHYTSFLFRALNLKHETILVSYKLQYPRFLFKKSQKDYSNARLKVEDTKFWINTMNPFNCILAGKKIKRETPDLVIIQWWHPYFSPCYWLLEKAIGNKCKILFICHNVFPHERFPLDRWLTKRILIHADYYIVHSKQDEQDLVMIKPNANYKRTVLPSFNMFRIQDISKPEAREILNIADDQQILLFFGFVREYKGLKYLIYAMREVILELPDSRLLIVGDFGDDKEAYLQLIREQQVEGVIDIYDGYIPDQEVEKFFAACDLVVLPYETATQSGIVQVAYGFDKPVIVTNVGGLPEVVEDGKTGYIVNAKNHGELAQAICQYFREGNEVAFTESIKKESYKYSWNRLTDIIENLVK